ncbi:hypothetical protein [Novosphingobium profundi]|uniref:hypothetical protein n=1 Tax=Novosphingobium profundi TaxID=1774954 RepID=UPI001CFC714E|nr:hypothetical protein [Novosphingobium profundi]
MISRSNALTGQVSIAHDLRGVGSDSAAVRLLRDMMLCAGGTILGAKADGRLAYYTMQSICSGDGFNLLASVSVHLRILPATSALMLLVAIACQWPGRAAHGSRPAFTPRERVGRWSAFALRTGLFFLAMMLAMSVMQPVALWVLPPSPSSAVLASVVGMLLLAIVAAALRPLALRVPFLVPLCCR